MGFTCKNCKKLKKNKGNLCLNCQKMFQKNFLKIQKEIESLESKIEFEHNSNNTSYIEDVIKSINLHEKLYKYATYLENQVHIDPPTYKEFKDNVVKDLKIYTKYKINHFINLFIDEQNLRVKRELITLKEDLDYYKEVYPDYIEIFDTKDIEDILKNNEDIIDLVEINNKTLEDIDNMSGLEFEKYIANLFTKLGYEKVVTTPASGDFGIDVIAFKEDIKYGIQCKNYKEPLSNKCVQEAFSGKEYYNCHVGIVITNSTFTPHAIAQAKSNGILLWDRNKLISLINKVKK